jgi:hypothetical protein
MPHALSAMLADDGLQRRDAAGRFEERGRRSSGRGPGSTAISECESLPGRSMLTRAVRALSPPLRLPRLYTTLALNGAWMLVLAGVGMILFGTIRKRCEHPLRVDAVTRLVIPMVIQTIQLALSGPNRADDTSHLTSLDPTGANQPDAEHQPTELAVGVRIPRGVPRHREQLGPGCGGLPVMPARADHLV